MPRRPESLDHGDLLTDAVMALLVESGATGVTLRRLADRRGISVGALTTRWGNRARMMHVAINYFRQRCTEDMADRGISEGVLAMLPASESEVEDCQIWLAFCDLARTDATLALCVTDQRAQERELLCALLARQGGASGVDESTVDLLLAVVDGLRTALCAPEPMLPERARELLDSHLTTLGPSCLIAVG